MFSDPALRSYTDRLARLLAGAQGSEILAELQKVSIGASNGSAAPPDADMADSADIGAWRIERGPDGIALRRRDDVGPGWSGMRYVPAAGGARRLVLLGESAARGWPYDPAFGCAQVLERNLGAIEPGVYQCVDLARTGAVTADLHALAARLPAIAPDVVVSFVGNNWTLGPLAEEAPPSAPEQLELRNALARSLREEGYTGMGRVLDATVLQRARCFLDRLVDLQRTHHTQIVAVIPEFNLRGWIPPADIEVPVLSPEAMTAWYALYGEAQTAVEDRRWAVLGEIAARMRDLDGGASPIPGRLAGVASLERGDGAAARAAFEESRDSVCRLFVRYVPRITGPVQRLIADYAAVHGWQCVDLRAVLASPDCPELPDERYFHDYCHMSDTGIELAMAAVTDAVLGLEAGTTKPGPGLPADQRAFAYAHAASHLAYTGQPARVVRQRLRAALETAPALAGPLTSLRDMLSAPIPRWIHPAAADLGDAPQVREFLATLAGTRGLSPWLWTLRECLGDVLGPETTGDCGAELNLLLGPDGERQALPNWLSARSCLHATSQWSSLPFALREACPATLELTYRMPTEGGSAAAAVFFNDTIVGELPWQDRWTQVIFPLSAASSRPGVNRIAIRWPVPAPDPMACSASDAAALAVGELPYVLPRFGEVYSAWIRPENP